MNKALILFLYATAMTFVLRNYYKNNSGLPDPRVTAAPTYLYAGLDIVSGFTGGFTVPLALGLTVALIWQSEGLGKKQPGTSGAAKQHAGGLFPQGGPQVQTGGR